MKRTIADLSTELDACREAQAAAISESESNYMSGAILALEWALGEAITPPSMGAGL